MKLEHCPSPFGGGGPPSAVVGGQCVNECKILRVGARYTMKRERWNYYGDLSYEHELDGRAAGRANGMAIRGADTSGGSVRLELGAKLLANEKSPWSLDLNLTGYAGKTQGLQGGASVKFMF